MREGDTVEDFELLDQSGTTRRLSALQGSNRAVVFFYPAAMTSGCTKESCHFRDLASEFAARGAVRIGISMDPVDKQATFASTHGLDYPLLSDPDGAIARRFGVKRAFDALKVRRKTFVLDEHRRVLGVIGSELNMDAHADRALSILGAAPQRSEGATQ